MDGAPLDRLAHLAALLDEVVALADAHPILRPAEVPVREVRTVAGQTPADRADYEWMRALVHDLVERRDRLPADERRRLALNADLRQFHFHLDEELHAQRGALDPVVLDRSLTFLKRHIVRLRAEYDERRHQHLHPEERELLLALAEVVEARYERNLAEHYAQVGYRRPFVDKFYRDYALDGIPGGLLLELDRLAHDPGWELFVCVCKGGLPFTILLELLGVPSARIVHLMAGRASGSHYEQEHLFQPVDFALGDLTGRAVLLVENNAASGRTLAALARRVAAARPARLGVFLDYVYTDVGGLDRGNLRARSGVDFDEVLVGPWPAPRPAQAPRLRRIREELARGVARCAR